jgi:hypothetical protein
MAFQREGQMGMDGTVTRTEYSHKKGERAERRVLQESGIFAPPEGSQFARSTVHREEFTEKDQTDRVQPHRPIQNLQLGGPQASFSSVSREDYLGKQLEENGGHSPGMNRRRTGNESSFGLNEMDPTEWAQQYARTMTQEEFAAPTDIERQHPVVHLSGLSISDPAGEFYCVG